MAAKDYTFTPQELERLRRASDITEIQGIMANFVDCLSKMHPADAYKLFANVEGSSIEIAECGEYDGPKHIKAFLEAYDAYMADASDKRGYMEFQNICNPCVVVKKDHSEAMGYWTIIAPSAKWAMPVPCDQEKLTAHWGCGKYICTFINTEKGWKIKNLKLVWFLRSPFIEGWVAQADCVHMPAFPGLTPDKEPDYYNVYNADYGCASGGIEWGPYIPDDYDK